MDALRDGGIGKVIDDGMSVLGAVVDVGQVLDSVAKSIPIKTTHERNIVALISAVEPMANAWRPAWLWRLDMLLDYINAKRRAKRDVEWYVACAFSALQQPIGHDGAQ